MKNLKPLILEAFLNIGNLLGNLFLIFLALALFIPLFPVAIVWKIYVSIAREDRKAREILSGTGKFFCAIAIALDQLGNVAFGGLFNDLLLRDPNLFPFGKTHETISEVLGWNQYLGNLTGTGKTVASVIDFCDFTQEEHCQNAMISGLFDAKYKIIFHKKHIAEHESIERTKEFFEKYN